MESKYNQELLRINIAKMMDENSPFGCGYCKHQTVKLKHHNRSQFKFSVKSIPANILQRMLEKGWGRSGNLMYKKNYENCCCKLYQPRVNINNFTISKEQKKVMKRFRKYLSGEYELNKINNIINKTNNINVNKDKEKEEDLIQNKFSDILKDYLVSKNFFDILNKHIQNEDDINAIFEKLLSAKIRKNNNKKNDYDYSCDIIFIIKNMIISLRKKNGINVNDNINEINNNKDKNKNKKNNINIELEQNEEYKNFINEIYNDFINYYKPKLTDEIISFNSSTGHINFKISNSNKINININNKQQNKEKNNTNKINANKINLNQNLNNNQKEKFILDYFKEIVPEPEIYLPLKHIYSLELTDKISLSINDERFLLYQKYELAVHKEFSTLKNYNDFIGTSPIIKKRIIKPKDLYLKTNHPELYPDYYGTYNLIHKIDGVIIAVTVIDILPNYLESLYCYYDPDFSFLDLGVVTAIREIEYMKSFQELIDKNFMYYSLGEMSQSVSKLKYKGNYSPTEIMDHFTDIYVPLTDKVKALIGDNECHCLTMHGYNRINYEYFSHEEIEYYINNIFIDVFGDQVLLGDFLELYLTDDLNDLNFKNIIPYTMRRLMEIIDIETFNKIVFYCNFYE